MKPVLRLFQHLIFAALCLGGLVEVKGAVSSTTSWVQYTLSTNPQALTVTFVFTNSTDLSVLMTRGTANPVVLTQNSDYSVSGGSGSTGTVTTIAGGSHGVIVTDTITITRGVPLTQTTTYSTGGPFTPAMVGASVDKLTEIAQQLNLAKVNSLRFPPDESTDGTLYLSSRAGKLLGFDANGDIEWQTSQTAATAQGTANQILVNATSGSAQSGPWTFTLSPNIIQLGASGYELIVGLTGGDRVGISGQTAGSGTGLVFLDSLGSSFAKGILDGSDLDFRIAGVSQGHVTDTGLNSMAVGATTPAAGTFTNLTATGATINFTAVSTAMTVGGGGSGSNGDTIRINGSTATGSGPQLAFKSGSDFAYIGRAAQLSGSGTSNDLWIQSVSNSVKIVNGATQSAVFTATDTTFIGTVTTAAPSGDTAGAFRVGTYHASAPTADGYVNVTVAGVVYKFLVDAP